MFVRVQFDDIKIFAFNNTKTSYGQVYVLIKDGVQEHENFRTSGSCKKPRTERMYGAQEERPERIFY